jgi:organic hydroperoxide reductase OsmC/OhrA
MDERTFTLRLDHQGGYRFLVDFGIDGVPALAVDEPPPLGEGAGPAASRMLAAATAQCLASSLLFCLRKSRAEVRDIGVEVDATIQRSEKGRLRVSRLKVRLTPDLAEEDLGRLERCRTLFEDFCIVTQSVRNGVNIDVEVDASSSAPQT